MMRNELSLRGFKSGRTRVFREQDAYHSSVISAPSFIHDIYCNQNREKKLKREGT